MKSEICTINKKIEHIVEYMKNDVFTKISSRISNTPEFKTFTNDKLDIIASKMPEINRINNSFGRSNTQTTNVLMTLTMLNDSSPYRLLRQCAAQIEDRRKALKETVFSIKEKRIRLLEIEYLISNNTTLTNFDEMRLRNEAEHIICDINDNIIYIEGSLKDITSFQESYEQIRLSNNIPENWDEVDFENKEIEHHLRIAFLHAYRDIQNHGSIGMGTLEYIGQFGVHPFIAHAEVHHYISKLENDYKNEITIDINSLNNWLNFMIEKYKNEYFKVLNNIGITNLINSNFLYTDRNKEIEE